MLKSLKSVSCGYITHWDKRISDKHAKRTIIQTIRVYDNILIATDKMDL